MGVLDKNCIDDSEHSSKELIYTGGDKGIFFYEKKYVYIYNNNNNGNYYHLDVE